MRSKSLSVPLGSPAAVGEGGVEAAALLDQAFTVNSLLMTHNF